MSAKQSSRKSLTRRLDLWLMAKGFLSKTGLVLLGIALLLAFISFSKGIQVLMFIPAFVLALFVYSFFDIFPFRKQIEASWQETEHGFQLLLVFHQHRDFCQFLLLFDDGEKSEFLRPNRNLRFCMPERKGRYFLIVQGKFDIFRAVLPLPAMPKKKKRLKSVEAEEGELYFSLQPYEEGDDLRHVDAMQTAKRNMLYIKRIIHEAPIKDPRREEGLRFFQLLGSLPLRRKEDVATGRITEWMMVATAVLAAHLEWGFWGFTMFAVFSIAFILVWLHVLRWKPLGRKAMNTSALLLFIACFIEGGKMDDTVLAGAHFLILLAIWKHLFYRERRDAFTYIFLILFVFVALSLSTLSAWFIFLFFLFLLESIALFTHYAVGERKEEFQRSFGRPATKKAYLRMNTAVIVTTILLFFILPHGNRAKDTSLLEQTKQQPQTGFSEEVSLNDVLSIKHDFSKQFVIENAVSSEIPLYQDLYWRGMRFTDFVDGKWKKPSAFKQSFIGSEVPKNHNLKTWQIRYYPDGEDALFVPTAPISAAGSFFRSFGQDNTILKFYKPEYSDVSVELTFLEDEKGYPKLPGPPVLLQKPAPLGPKIKQLMQPFWDSLPTAVAEDPQQLSRYIRDEAGFSYSLQDTARNLESFLYSEKQGHCEYFATVLTLTLQHFGHTAIYVNGFQGGEWNNNAHAWVVRGIHAHSWVEIFDADAGWIRLDATPQSTETFFQFRNSGVFKQIVQIYDTLELRWFEYVVSYTGDRQRNFFRKLYENREFIFLFLSIYAIWRVGKKTHKRFLLPHLRRTPRERFLWWLKRKTSGDSFVLEPLQHEYPQLVRETREKIFGSSPVPSEIRNLRKQWNSVLRKRSRGS